MRREPSGRPAKGRHAFPPPLWQDAATAAMLALLARDVPSARHILTGIPAGPAVLLVLPAAQALAHLASGGPVGRIRVHGKPASPVCAAGFCYAGIPCEMPACAHTCHLGMPGMDDTVIVGVPG